MRPVIRPAITAALLATCAGVAAAQPILRPAPGAPTSLTPQQAAARAIYKEMVEINTADSVGSVTKSAQALAARFKAAGFPAADIHLVGPADKPEKQNLVVRYRGKGSGKPILLLAHLDVVQAKRSDWANDPFVMREESGYFLGRGVADDKSMAAILAANVLRYKQENWIPERDLILALTADEEGGGANGVSWLIANRKELIDAEYAINEGGGGTLGPDDKPLFHSVQAAEKVYADFTLTVRNTGGHSSVPRKDNAIYSLAAALLKVQQYTFPVELNDVTRPFFEQTAKVEMPSLAAAMRALSANPADTAAARIISTDPRYASMLRTTCVATMLDGGHAANALPQTATANVNCRIAPTSKASTVKAALQRIIGDTAVAITTDRPDRSDGAPTPINATLLQATTSLTKQMFNGVPVIPTMSTGATDGYRLRAAGIPTYGVSGIFSSPGETNAHGRDEKLRIKSFYDGLDFLYQLVKQVSGPLKPMS
ncbi:M20/M25/M40 family metallo-hydrolase [Gemmatimonas sp.]|uniref:M20/M25/M40 family metallo-hydrolase n=1 Tax=Gemmatimonas sp. TaxID=1962908 RepID=UPI00333FAE10